MTYVETEISAGTAVIRLHRGKVNPLNGQVVDELRANFQAMENDAEITAVIFTGHGKFFSFGFDIPEFLSFSKAEFTRYLTNFADLYTYLFQYPKPLVAALNGHTVAGGCMLALACDRRLMADGSGKISLNEISFGASVFAGSTEMLRFRVGSATATDILYSGAMYSAREAAALGLVDEVTDKTVLMDRAMAVASDLGSKNPAAFASIKSLLRDPVANEMKQRESLSIREFVDIWYAEPTWSNVRKILIR